MINIRTKLFLTYLLLILFTITLMGSLFYFLTREHLLKSKEAYLGKSAEYFIKFITPITEGDDLKSAVLYFTRQCWEQLDYQLTVIDKESTVVYDSRSMASYVAKGDKWEKALFGKETVWIEKQPDGQKIFKCIPIIANNNIIGAARLSLSLSELDDIFSIMRKYFFLTFFLSLFAAIGASLFFIRTLMKPIARIRDTAVRIAEGDLSSRVDYVSNDELGDLSKTINFMSSELKKLEEIRSEFLGNVSHELKTPLTIIKGFVITLMSDPDAPKEWIRSFELINRETDRLTRLVNELLELTRLRSGRVALQMSMVDLSELIMNVHSQLSPKAAENEIKLHFLNCEKLPKVKVDADRIKEVFINLIDNALKYISSGGEVTVSANVIFSGIEINVKDNGPGIPEEEIPFLFERFFRGGSTRHKKVEGTGLGLAIVKEIIEAHKGAISVSSKVGEGTVFTVLLNLSLGEDS